MNILIIGDSLAGERPDGISKENRWPWLLQKINIRGNCINLSKGFSTSNRLRKIKIETYKNIDLVIIQLGIVDCVPRVFSKIETQIIARIPKIFREFILKIFKRYRKRTSSRSYVSVGQYEENFISFINKFNKKIIIIKILKPGIKFNTINPMASSSINNYNLVLDKLNNLYSNIQLVEVPNDKVDDFTLNDGYHLNEIGHKFISNEIKLF